VTTSGVRIATHSGVVLYCQPDVLEGTPRKTITDPEKRVRNVCSNIVHFLGIRLKRDSLHAIVMTPKRPECSPLKGAALDA
jgi:hypothetical protein